MGQSTNSTSIACAIEGKKGIESFEILFGHHKYQDLDEAQEAALGTVLAFANDGWPWYLRQRIVSFTEDDVRWARLVRFLRTYGARQPSLVWYCEFIRDMANHARSESEANSWRKPGKRLMGELGICY